MVEEEAAWAFTEDLAASLVHLEALPGGRLGQCWVSTLFATFNDRSLRACLLLSFIILNQMADKPFWAARDLNFSLSFWPPSIGAGLH